MQKNMKHKFIKWKNPRRGEAEVKVEAEGAVDHVVQILTVKAMQDKKITEVTKMTVNIATKRNQRRNTEVLQLVVQILITRKEKNVRKKADINRRSQNIEKGIDLVLIMTQIKIMLERVTVKIGIRLLSMTQGVL